MLSTLTTSLEERTRMKSVSIFLTGHRGFLSLMMNINHQNTHTGSEELERILNIERFSY